MTTKKTLNQKLFDLQSEVGKITKKETNPFFKSKYFDINGLLEHLHPLLEKHRLLLIQPIEGGSVYSKIIDVDGDNFVESGIELPQITDPQKLGSAITYYRRYTLQSLLGLQAEDDDGNKASTPELKWLNKGTKDFNRAVATIKTSDKDMSYLRTKFRISKETEQLILEAAK